MRLRNIFTMLAAASILTFVGCQEPERFLDEVRVSMSYISLPMEGGDVKVEVDAVADWSIVAWNAAEQVEAEIPEWLTVEPASGSKGKVEVVFSAEATTESKEVVLHLNCDGACQMLNVVQITEKAEPEIKTCEWINENGEDGVVYRPKGVVTLVNASYATYGGFSINDGTATLVVYGSDTKGDYPDLAIGDEVVVEGPWSPNYANFGNGSQIVSLSKSLIKVEKISPVGPLAAEGDVFTVTLTNKGDDLAISIPEADQTWLKYSEPFVSGTTAVVEFTAAVNTETPRSTTVTFTTTSGGTEYTASVTMDQNGAIPQRTIAEAVSSGELSLVVGKVLLLNQKGVLITDGTDVLYGYKGAAVEGVAVGDIVEMIGTVTRYNGGRSMNAPTIKETEGTVPAYKAPTPVTLDAAKCAELTAADADFTTPYVTVSGVAEVDKYNNIIVKVVENESTYTIKSYYGNESFADWKDKNVQVSGYAYNAYNDSKQVNLLVTSVNEVATE